MKKCGVWLTSTLERYKVYPSTLVRYSGSSRRTCSSGAFRPSYVYSFIVYLSFPPLHHMSSGSHSVDDSAVRKFDMHVHTSALTVDEVNSLIEKYVVPMNLRLRVPSSTMTMNALSANSIVAKTMSQFLKFPMAAGVRIGKGSTFKENEVISQHTIEPLLVGSSIPATSDYRKRAAGGEYSRPPKNKKVAPISMGLSESDDADSNQGASGTHHSASPLTTVHLENVNTTTNGSNLALESAVLSAPLSKVQLVISFLNETRVATAMLPRAHESPPSAFIVAWNLTTHSIMNDAESCRDMMINLATPARYEVLNNDFEELYESHQRCHKVSDKLTETQQQLVDALRSQSILFEDHKNLQQVHLGCVSQEAALVEKLVVAKKQKDDLLDQNKAQATQIKRLEEALAVKTFSLSEAERDRLHLSNDYKQSLVEVFNQAIITGWSDGIKVGRLEEDIKAIDDMFVKSYPYMEKLVESFQLPLGDLQNKWRTS
nr:hypothetical protein [Tanacetum cinerariifolium]